MPLRNAPKILRGAFVEYGLSIPPLFVVFQFNPEQLTRGRSVSFAGPNETLECPRCESDTTPRPRTVDRTRSLRQYHKDHGDLSEIQQNQRVTVEEETISFDIRLDATDKLEDGDLIASQFGVLPQLATLELLVQPKEEGLLGAAIGSLLGSSGGFSFTNKPNPPMVLFIWGYKRVLPVNITSLRVTETVFSTLLDPTRATVSVSLTVIEGKNPVYSYSKVLKEISSALNLANVADLVHVVVPG